MMFLYENNDHYLITLYEESLKHYEEHHVNIVYKYKKVTRDYIIKHKFISQIMFITIINILYTTLNYVLYSKFPSLIEIIQVIGVGLVLLDLFWRYYLEIE